MWRLPSLASITQVQSNEQNSRQLPNPSKNYRSPAGLYSYKKPTKPTNRRQVIDYTRQYVVGFGFRGPKTRHGNPTNRLATTYHSPASVPASWSSGSSGRRTPDRKSLASGKS